MKPMYIFFFLLIERLEINERKKLGTFKRKMYQRDNSPFLRIPRVTSSSNVSVRQNSLSSLVTAAQNLSKTCMSSNGMLFIYLVWWRTYHIPSD